MSDLMIDEDNICCVDREEAIELCLTETSNPSKENKNEIITFLEECDDENMDAIVIKFLLLNYLDCSDENVKFMAELLNDNTRNKDLLIETKGMNPFFRYRLAQYIEKNVIKYTRIPKLSTALPLCVKV